MSARSVLLTVSGRIPADLDAQIAAGRRPRADYRELARGLGADLIDVDTARRETGTLGRLIERVAGAGVLLAWACFRRRAAYRLIITDGEQIGLPLAMLCTCVRPARAPRHVMITHVISVRKKMLFLDWLRAESRIDRFVVYASWQRQFIIRRWRLPESRVIRVPFMVDARFFAPERVRGAAAIPQICAVGLERRDYPTLLRAVAGLPAGVVIAAASPWSKCADETDHAALPANVDVRRLSLYDLRQLYADSRFLVMPLNDVQFQAGVTAILEAMAMAKAVICSRVAGQTDVVVDGETGLYVPPNDPPALRRAIETLLAEPELAERMGQEGRRRVEADMSLERYVERFRAIADDVVAEVPAAAGL